jgi:hypothetical protein
VLSTVSFKKMLFLQSLSGVDWGLMWL